MRQKITALFTIILFGILLSLLLWLFFPTKKTEKISIVSPLPSFLSLPQNKEVSTLSLFSPILDFLTSGITPVVRGRSALSYDLDNNKTLYSKNTNEELPMASLTKIMTAVVSLEHPKVDNRYLVKKQDLVGENAMGLTAGEVMSQEELLYGLVLNSGNDAAEVLASNFSGGRSVFIRAMNEKAQALGLKDTHFTNPSGLEGDGNQHTTAHDLLVITKYALEQFPLFAQVAQTVSYHIPYSPLHKEFYLDNEVNLLTSYPGVKGVKDGYTPEAGLCLVTYLDYKDHKIIAIVLGSDDRRGDMKHILDTSLIRLGVTPPKHD